ncbi:MAG: glycosyltransferase [Actinobacteria bacterium]|nr:glycosyltransferase [Actinomycetota bacterium]
MSQPPAVTVITPWYPSAPEPHVGVFVRSQVHALVEAGARVQVIHTREDRLHADGSFVPLQGRWQRWLRARRGDWLSHDLVGDVAVPLARVPVPRPKHINRYDQATLHAIATQVGLELLDPVEVAHAHVGMLSGWAAAELLESDVPLLVTEHYSAMLSSQKLGPRVKRLYRKALARSFRTLAVSSALRDKLLSDFPDAHDRLSVVPNILANPPAAVASASGRPIRDWICVGAVIEGKRPSLVLESFARFAESAGDATLTFVGAGEELPVVARRAQELGLTQRVTLTGALDPETTSRLIGQADVLVHLSRLETFSIVTAEAIAAGTPVIVADSGGPRDIMDAEVAPLAGRLLGPDPTADQVSAAVAELEDDPALDLSTAATIVAQRYAPGSVAQQLLRLYEEGLVAAHD